MKLQEHLHPRFEIMGEITIRQRDRFMAGFDRSSPRAVATLVPERNTRSAAERDGNKSPSRTRAFTPITYSGIS